MTTIFLNSGVNFPSHTQIAHLVKNAGEHLEGNAISLGNRSQMILGQTIGYLIMLPLFLAIGSSMLAARAFESISN